MKQNPIEQFYTVINQNSAHIIIHLTLYHKIPTFNYPGKLPSDNIVAKGENVGNKHFLLLPQRFLLIPKGIFVFIYIYFVTCKYFQLGLV